MKIKSILSVLLGLATCTITVASEENIGVEPEFIIQCNTIVSNGKTFPRVSKFVAKNGHIQMVAKDGKLGRKSKLVEFDRDTDLSSTPYFSFNSYTQHDHIKTYDSYLLGSDGNLTWEVADINTSRNILVSVSKFELQNCLTLGLD